MRTLLSSKETLLTYLLERSMQSRKTHRQQPRMKPILATSLQHLFSFSLTNMFSHLGAPMVEAYRFGCLSRQIAAFFFFSIHGDLPPALHISSHNPAKKTASFLSNLCRRDPPPSVESSTTKTFITPTAPR